MDALSEMQSMRKPDDGVLARIDKYELLRELGGGGFGTVYLARDTVAEVERAVKGLPPGVKGCPAELENVRANFALVSRLHHPHIAAALDLHLAQEVWYGDEKVRKNLRVSTGETLLVMEYAPGVTLSQWRLQFPDHKVPFPLALEITRQVAEALDYAHSRKILHRDIKPANVMVETKLDGTFVARVLDFGLAAEIRSSLGRVSNDVGDTSGTRPYMAPEQWLGRRQGAETDQYALAVLFYELVSGNVPFASAFETNDPAVMRLSVTQDPPEIPPELPKTSRRALAKALAKQPPTRFPDCVAFAEALAGKKKRGPLLPWSLMAAVFIIAAAVGAWRWTKGGGEMPEPPQPTPTNTTVTVTTQPKPVAPPPPVATNTPPAPSKPVAPVPPATGMTGGTGVSGGTGVETVPPVATNTPPAPPKPVAPVTPATGMTGGTGVSGGTGVGTVPPVATNTPPAPSKPVAPMPPATGMTGRTGVSGGTGVETPPPVATNTPPAPSKPVAPMPPATGMTGRTGVSGGTGVETPPPVATNTPPAPSKPVAPVAPVTPVPPVATNTPVATVTSAKAKPSDGSLSVKELSSLDTKTLKAGEARRVKLANGQTIWLHWCPPGSFWMDKPSREVRIGRGFWMARHEVSQALWTKVMGSNPSDRRRGQFAGAMSDAPVCNVSRDDCLRFIDALNQDNKTTGFRLPLDAEWEYAAKAGGNVFPQFAARGQRLPPQGSLGANDWGLCDLFGGVQEWCHDDFPMETATLWKRMFSRRPGNLLRGGTDARPGCGRLRAKTTGRSPTFGLRLCFGGW